MANRERGEVAISLGAREFTMRPTHEAIAEIEEGTGQAITITAGRLIRSVAMVQANRPDQMDIGFKDLVTIITAGVRAGGTKLQRGQVAEKIAADGMSTFIPPCTKFLTNIIAGWQREGDQPGEAGAPEETGDTPSGA